MSIPILFEKATHLATNETIQQGIQAEKTNREQPTSPEANVTKTAQTITDSVIASGKTIPQVVIENSDSSLKKAEQMDTLNRDLGVSPVRSAIETTADSNLPPAEINSKQGL